jgi:hypothetical protein
MRGRLEWFGLSNFAFGALVLLSLGLLSGCQSLEPPKTTDMTWDEPAAPKPPPEPVARDVEDAATVLRLQQMLADLGHEPGPADGVPGPRTRRAVREYQAKSGLIGDGRITADLLRRLEDSHRQAQVQEAKQTPREDQDAETGPKPKAGGLPAYEAGNTFVYSDGHVDTVVGLKGDAVRWRRDDGTKFTTSRNFLLPWANWQSESESGTHTWDGEADALWPRASGQEVSYRIDAVVMERASGALTKATEHWRCRLAGRRHVTVMAGDFNAFKLICDRAESASAPALQRVWYYAPSIQHYIRVENRGPAAEEISEVELITIRPGGKGWPPIARAALSRAVEAALETASNGRETPWQSSGVDTRVSIKPTSRFESGDGRVCRTFLQTWSGKDGERRYPGAACQDPSGQWRIPGLEDGADETLAVSKGQS